MRPTIRHLARNLIIVPGCLALLAIFGCSAQDPDERTQNTTPAESTSSAIPELEPDPELQKMLPDEVRKSGKIVSVNNGSFPPYIIVGSGGEETGASADLLNALGQLWDVDITEETVEGLPGVLSGIASDRYQMAFGPVGDFKEREKQADFVDYVQEFVVFAVPEGNPKQITDLDSTCGNRIAVMAGGSAEQVIKTQAKTCTKKGAEPLKVMSFKDQPSSVLSVQSGRADAFFSSQAPLTYFVQESDGELELAGTGQENGFDDLYQGAVVEKDSEYGPLLEKSLQKLFEDGTYEQIMKKWGLEGNMLDEPGMNMAVS